MKYYKPIVADGKTYSIDNVRLSLRGKQAEVQSFMNSLSGFEEEFDVGEYKYFQSFKMFTYRHLFNFKMSDSSFTLGIDFIDAKKHDSIIGFADFNPNKVSGDRRYKYLYNLILDHFKEVKIVRWDLAIDIPIERSYLKLKPDMRNYETHKSHKGYTEYLGVRNTPGRVKLYDKTRESDLDYDLTRLEITVGGKCEYKDLAVPEVLGMVKQIGIDTLTNLTGTELVLYRLLLTAPDMMYEYKSLGRKMQAKLKPYLFREDKALILDIKTYTELLNIIRTFEKDYIRTL